MTLTDFLLARIAEDEADARATAPDWDSDDTDNFYERQPHRARCGWRMGEGLEVGCTCGYPARVLAECAAKRVAVNWYLNDDEVVMGPTVEALAAVYADHPDYREEWRP